MILDANALVRALVSLLGYESKLEQEFGADVTPAATGDDAIPSIRRGDGSRSRLFKSADADGDGIISFADFLGIAVRCKVSACLHMTHELLSATDSSHNTTHDLSPRNGALRALTHDVADRESSMRHLVPVRGRLRIDAERLEQACRPRRPSRRIGRRP